MKKLIFRREASDTPNKNVTFLFGNTILADGGYSGANFARAAAEILGCEIEIAKRSEMHKFVVMRKRWVVERYFAWLEKCRRLWKNCERKINTSLQMTVLAFATLILKRL